MSVNLREARAAYFRRAGFDETSYSDRWVTVRFGRVPFRFPNTKARIEAVRYHDLHHTLTGYDTSLTGESEIAAWEIATGCGRYYVAWILNFFGILIGLIIAPRRTIRAFVRGLGSRNLYARPFDDALPDRPVDDVRRELKI